jgi:hypothetical protein
MKAPRGAVAQITGVELRNNENYHCRTRDFACTREPFSTHESESVEQIAQSMDVYRLFQMRRNFDAVHLC